MFYFPVLHCDVLENAQLMLPLSIIWMIRKNKDFYVSMCSLSSSWVVVYWTAGKFQGTPLYIFTECILRGLCHINSRSDYDRYNVDGMVRLITENQAIINTENSLKNSWGRSLKWELLEGVRWGYVWLTCVCGEVSGLPMFFLYGMRYGDTVVWLCVFLCLYVFM